MTQAGTLLREARERAGLTQAELASRVATTQSAIARAERATEPSFGRLVALLAACGIEMQVHLSRFDGDTGDGPTGAWTVPPSVGELAGADVPFVLTGRAAAAAMGLGVESAVPLVVPDVTPEALDGVAGVLDRLGARRRVEDAPDEGTLPMDRSAAALRRRRRWALATVDGPLDVDFEPPGTRGFVDLARRAIDRDGISVSSPADTARVLDAIGDDLALVTRLRALDA